MCEPETEIECAACDSVPIYIHTLHGQIFIFIFFTKFWNLFFFLSHPGAKALCEVRL